jgi:hypothetical protein
MPVICIGQQPNGFFPKRFFVAKLRTARRLQREIGGEIVLFYHDSDHDYRETVTTLHDKTNGNEVKLNFTQENKLQKKYSPMYLKRIPAGWREEIARKLPTFVDAPLVDLFKSVEADNVADFCLEMYRGMALLDGVRVVRSSDPAFRSAASELESGYFADVPYDGEIVRAQELDGRLKLHQGGQQYLELPEQRLEKTQKNPRWDQRFGWMQRVIGCTHYVTGFSEWDYLERSAFPDVDFVKREAVDRPEEAWTAVGL